MVLAHPAPPSPMHRFSILLAILALVLALGASLPGTDIEEPRADASWHTELSELRGEMAALGSSLDGLSKQIVHLDRRVVAQDLWIQDLATPLESWKPEQVWARLDDLEAGVLDRWTGLARTVDATATLAKEAGRGLTALHDDLYPLPGHLWHGMLAPTVQLSGRSTVGSGVLLDTRSADGESSGPARLLTSWHVVRDLLADPESEEQGIPVRIYMEDGTTRQEWGRVLARDTDLDAALLELTGDPGALAGASLPTREQLASMRVFHPVYAVGCPLGSDPIPSHGELSDLSHEVDGQGYWMISAPTFIGNSGGGVFDGKSLRLLGIFTKLYTHGSRRTVVPHMGLVTPLSSIYDWLESCGQGDLVPH